MSLVPPELEVKLTAGAKLDRYELLCPIAEGGMGVCWLARIVGKHGFERLVAIKTMKPQYATDPQFQRMFLDEARIASRIEHPNVAHILDLGEHDGVLFLVMEFVDGDSLMKLRHVLEKKKEKIPIGVLLRLMADTCGGLHAAHELQGPEGTPLGVVHRDVSPQNILVSPTGTAKLIDFGIARARDRTAGSTSTGEIKGKLQYMAPEQARGREEVDRRADIFGVGAILYDLIVGRPAYLGENQFATLALLVTGAPPAPLPASVPGPVAAAILRALAHERALRFETAREMQDALESAMIESGLVTSSTAVAAFVHAHLSHRADKRKQAIAAAIAGVARASAPALLSDGDSGPIARSPNTPNKPPDVTKPGVGEGPSPGGARSDTDVGTPALEASNLEPEPLRAAPRFPRTTLLVAGGCAALLVVAAVSIGLRRTDAAVPIAAQVVQAPEPSGQEVPGPAVSASAAPSTEPQAQVPPDAAAAVVSAATRRTTPPRPAGTSRPQPAGSARRKNKGVNDGF